MAILSHDEQTSALIEKDQGESANMLNLPEFKQFAQYPDGSEARLSGKDAHMRYGVKAAELVMNLGGEFLFGSDANTLVIADSDLQWNMVVLVKHPSIAAFNEMTNSREYAVIHRHCEAGLAHQTLVQC
jgi:uncharacterized protein (DUF1330 family)